MAQPSPMPALKLSAQRARQPPVMRAAARAIEQPAGSRVSPLCLLVVTVGAQQ